MKTANWILAFTVFIALMTAGCTDEPGDDDDEDDDEVVVSGGDDDKNTVPGIVSVSLGFDHSTYEMGEDIAATVTVPADVSIVGSDGQRRPIRRWSG